MTFTARLRSVGPALFVGLILALLANYFLTGTLPVARQQLLEADVLGAQSLTLRLRANTGRVDVVPMTWTKGDLLRASVMHYGDLLFRVTGRTERLIIIEDRSSRPFYNLTRAEDLVWRVRINPEIPLSLDYAAQAASSTLDLRAFRLRALTAESSTGPLVAYLPKPETSYDVDWRGSTALSEVILAQGTAAELRLSAAHAQIIGLEDAGRDEQAQVWRTPDFDPGRPHVSLRLSSAGEVRIRFDQP
ncbi:MAG: hypothetical protein NZ750_12770 [Anaerolineae bacterium]|nr:hypothetical protein [Anaerolineae bacterium]MDW8173648.1 hypothetical protein [Anaerolineae bacterium]